MEYIVNNVGENYEVVLFQHDSRNWEIMIDKDLSVNKINLLIITRIDELTDEFLINESYDMSDLIVDYTTKIEQ